MRGEKLKQLCDDSGLKPQVIYERAGYNREHFYKILKKKDVSVEELTRIASAVGKKPGDLLENSASDLLLPELLPLVQQLKQFRPDALPRVQEMLRAAALMLEEAMAPSPLPPPARARAGAAPSVNPSSERQQTDKPYMPL